MHENFVVRYRAVCLSISSVVALCLLSTSFNSRIRDKRTLLEEGTPTSDRKSLIPFQGRYANHLRYSERSQALRRAFGRGASIPQKHDFVQLSASIPNERFVDLAEVSDFPDLDEDVQLKDAASHVNDIYKPFMPTQQQSIHDRAESPTFYEAYEDTKLPHEGEAGPGHPWRAESEALGTGPPLLPHAYPMDPAYYPPPPADALAAITINANGAGSTNTFNVAGPQAINVNIGRLYPDFDSMSYYYPDGVNPVAYADPPKASTEVVGEATIGDEVSAEAAVSQAIPGPLTIDSDDRFLPEPSGFLADM